MVEETQGLRGRSVRAAQKQAVKKDEVQPGGISLPEEGGV